MTLSSAIDGEISNKEMQFIQTCINNLPIFKTYNSEDLEKTLSMFFELLSGDNDPCLLYTSPSPRDKRQSRMPSSA